MTEPTPRPGPRNLVTDVPGLAVGHATDERVASGVTAVLCGRGATAAALVRGGGPGTRETEALATDALVGQVHGVVLSGGSVFGLAASDGATAYLSHHGRGIRLTAEGPAIPIVAGAVLHDLGNGGNKAWGMDPPYRALGVEACAAAEQTFALGSVGAGRGAMAGVDKGGVGSASLDLGHGLMVGALAAVNSVGAVRMGDGETFWAWPFEIDAEFGGVRPLAGGKLPGHAIDPFPQQSRLARLGRLQPGANTTLCVVATSARLTQAECRRVAHMADDGIARAIRPAHTPFDGDIVFALATGAVELEALPDGAGRLRAWYVARIGAAAGDCLARAIARGVHAAA